MRPVGTTSPLVLTLTFRSARMHQLFLLLLMMYLLPKHMLPMHLLLTHVLLW